jgi:hypothetical protein
LLVGEIGIDRHVFLYDLQFWELRRIVKGYRRRDILKYQLLRLCAYMSCFSMRDAEGKKPEDWLPFSFDKEEETTAPPMEQKDIDDLQALMASINKTKK